MPGSIAGAELPARTKPARRAAARDSGPWRPGGPRPGSAPVRRPLGDDEARRGLQAEGGAHMQQAERGVGAAGDLLGEVLRQDGEAEHGGGAGGGDDNQA